MANNQFRVISETTTDSFPGDRWPPWCVLNYAQGQHSFTLSVSNLHINNVTGVIYTLYTYIYKIYAAKLHPVFLWHQRSG